MAFWICTILPPIAAKAMDNGKRIVKYIADKAVEKAVDKVMDKPMDKIMAMVVDKVDGIVNIEGDISKLQTTLHMIQDIVQVAEEKQIDKHGKPTVFIQNWLRDLVDIGYEARDILDDFNTFSSCIIRARETSNPVHFISSLMLSYFGGLSSDTSKLPLTVLNRLEKDIRRVRERFDEKKKEGETFATLKSVVGEGSESVKNRRPEVGPFINKQRDGLFLGREEVKQEIMQKILHPSDDRVDVIVIWGMGGIGKTTLSQSIYNDESIKIVPRRWLCVGESKFSAEKVIREIVNDKQTIGIENLQTTLLKELSGDRFLIVLDDVWDVDGSEWDLLFNPLDSVGKGGMIIITRREKEVRPALINIQTAYYLEPLSEEDSWSIFESCAYVDGKADSTSELKRIGEDIVKKLNGHPLALKVVGRSLLKKDSSTWKKFLESKFPKDNEVMSALRWSYNHLPPHLKTCFTYCALFPKDHVLDKKELVQMWMAHDLIEKEKQERPEDVGAQYFEQLVNASLLQCVDEKYEKHEMYGFIHGKHVMHDLIHDLALLVSNGEFANSSLTNDKMETVRHVTITRGEYYSRLCKMEKLLTLYTPFYTIDDEITKTDVFNQLKSIRVLVLHSRKITYIPDCISELRHLRYLDVSKTDVRRLPYSLCHLYNLQMLAAPEYGYVDISFQYECFVKLSIYIVNISSLRYVRASLSTCKGVGKLTSLQELSCIDVCEGDNIRELGDMQILRGKLTIKGLENVEKLEDDVGALMDKQTHIDELVLEFHKQLEKSTISEEVLDALGCPPNLKYLRIAGYNGLKLPSWLLKNRTSKRKREYKHPKMNAANFMRSLSRLEICYCNGLKRLQLDALVSLKKLHIRNCSSLVQITSSICESLKILNLQNCESLRSLSIDIHGLDSVEDLHITGCPTLELAFKDGSSSSSSSGSSVAVPLRNISIDSTQVFRTLLHHELVSLESLEITDLEGFENFDETEANNFCKLRSLKSLKISQCEDLKSLPADFHKLSSLKSLSIEECPELQSLPPDFHKLSSLKNLLIDNCPQLQSLPPDFHKLSSLEELMINWCPQLQSFPPDFHKLSSLKSLSIEECPQLQSLPPDFHKLSSLKSLTINSCPELQSLPADGLPPSLSDLTIMDCPLLYERCKDESGFDWHKIKHILYKNITSENDEDEFGSDCSSSPSDREAISR